MKSILYALFLALLLSATANAATPSQNITFKIGWVDNTSGITQEDRFNVYRCIGVACTDFTLLGSVGADVTEFIDAIIDDPGNKVYRYRATAQNAAGESLPSNIGEITSPAIIVINVGAAPSGVVATILNVTVKP